MAEAVHMSPSYLHDCFKQAYGVTPHDYLIRVRLTEARRLLSDGRLTLAAVAAKTGFASQQYFTKLFKAETGVTPRRLPPPPPRRLPSVNAKRR